jgi:hypothetical protein
MKPIHWKDMTVAQFQKLGLLGDKVSEDDLIEVFYGRAKRDMTLDEISSIELQELTPPDFPRLPLFFYMKGKLYGRFDSQNMTFGEYIDLMDFAKDPLTNLTEFMSIAFRPVESITLWNKIKLKMAMMLFKHGGEKQVDYAIQLQDLVKYKIQPYNVGLNLMQAKEFEQLPAYLAQYTLSFFFLTSQVLLTNTHKSFLNNLMTQIAKTSPAKELQKKTSADGDGGDTPGL